MIRILNSLEYIEYYNKEVLDFINNSILQSSSRMICPGTFVSNIKVVLNTGIYWNETLDLLKIILKGKNYHKPSIENKISIVHSLCEE